MPVLDGQSSVCPERDMDGFFIHSLYSVDSWEGTPLRA